LEFFDYLQKEKPEYFDTFRELFDNSNNEEEYLAFANKLKLSPEQIEVLKKAIEEQPNENKGHSK